MGGAGLIRIIYVILALGVAWSAVSPSAVNDESSTKVLTKVDEPAIVESGGNESEPTKETTYSKEKQRTVDEKWKKYEATAYIAMCDTGCTGKTATGYNVKERTKIDGRTVIAVDPDVIPLGTSITVRLADGTTIEGRALDTGGAIKGRKIDVLMSTHKKAMSFGRQAVQVRIND